MRLRQPLLGWSCTPKVCIRLAAWLHIERSEVLCESAGGQWRKMLHAALIVAVKL